MTAPAPDPADPSRSLCAPYTSVLGTAFCGFVTAPPGSTILFSGSASNGGACTGNQQLGVFDANNLLLLFDAAPVARTFNTM